MACEFLNSFLDELFQFFQSVSRKIIPTVAGEFEIRQFVKLFFLPTGDECLGNFIKRHVKCRQATLGIIFQIVEIIRHGKVEKRQTIVKYRSKCVWLVCAVIHHQTEVIQMPVCVIAHQKSSYRRIQCFSNPRSFSCL